ncbi:hypothetical protein WMF45_29940 [Sorangium sp. So ce448]|uniref:hypothetical protein n=1 Tax=Sorangium sp. So ce448 TaxID=3133314 RepID=UPI003F5FF734
MGTSLLAKLTVDGAPVNAGRDDGLMVPLDAIAACVIGGASTPGGILTGARLAANDVPDINQGRNRRNGRNGRNRARHRTPPHAPDVRPSDITLLLRPAHSTPSANSAIITRIAAFQWGTDMARNTVVGLIPLIVLAGTGCGEDGEWLEEPLGEAQSALEAGNALNPNALNPNALNPNALNPNALNPNALAIGALSLISLGSQALTAILDPGPNGALSREHLRYAVECALESSQSFRFGWIDASGVYHDEIYTGVLGLARSWAWLPLDGDGQRWVSACLAARTNYYRIRVVISSRGPTKAINKQNSPELSTFTREEGAFWGNIYGSSPALYACHVPENAASSRAGLRDCAAGHIDETTGSIQPCGAIQLLGPCGSYCDPIAPKNGIYHPSCFTDPANRSATTSLHPITVFLE